MIRAEVVPMRAQCQACNEMPKQTHTTRVFLGNNSTWLCADCVRRTQGVLELIATGRARMVEI